MDKIDFKKLEEWEKLASKRKITTETEYNQVVAACNAVKKEIQEINKRRNVRTKEEAKLLNDFNNYLIDEKEYSRKSNELRYGIRHEDRFFWVEEKLQTQKDDYEKTVKKSQQNTKAAQNAAPKPSSTINSEKMTPAAANKPPSITNQKTAASSLVQEPIQQIKQPMAPPPGLTPKAINPKTMITSLEQSSVQSKVQDWLTQSTKQSSVAKPNSTIIEQKCEPIQKDLNKNSMNNNQKTLVFENKNHTHVESSIVKSLAQPIITQNVPKNIEIKPASISIKPKPDETIVEKPKEQPKKAIKTFNNISFSDFLDDPKPILTSKIETTVTRSNQSTVESKANAVLKPPPGINITLSNQNDRLDASNSQSLNFETLNKPESSKNQKIINFLQEKLNKQTINPPPGLESKSVTQMTIEAIPQQSSIQPTNSTTPTFMQPLQAQSTILNNESNKSTNMPRQSENPKSQIKSEPVKSNNQPTSISSIKNNEKSTLTSISSNVSKIENENQISNSKKFTQDTNSKPIKRNQTTENLKRPSVTSIEATVDEVLMEPPPMHVYSNQKPKRGNEIPSMKFLNEKAVQIQIELSESGKYVFFNEIAHLLLQHYNCTDLGQLGLHNIKQLDEVRGLMRIQEKINSFIIAVNIMSYVTIIEIERAVCDYLKVTTFSELNVGPLIKNNVLRKIFDLPAIDYYDYENSGKAEEINIVNMTYIELFDNLKKFLDKDKNWGKRDLQCEDFMTYLKDYLLLGDDNAVLGVKIYNFYNLLGALKSARFKTNDSIRNSMDKFRNEMNETVKQEQEWLKKRLEDTLNQLNEKFEKNLEQSPPTLEAIKDLQVRQQTLHVNGDQLVRELVSLFESIKDRSGKKNSIMAEFVQKTKNKEYIKYVLQLGFCFTDGSQFSDMITELRKNYPVDYESLSCAVLRKVTNALNENEIKHFLNDYLKPKKLKVCPINASEKNGTKHVEYGDDSDDSESSDDDSDDSTDDTSSEDIVKTSKPNGYRRKTVQISDLINKLKEIIVKRLNKDCLFISSAQLVQIEEQLVKEFHLKGFHEFDRNCSFLQFIIQNEDLIKELGFYITNDNFSSPKTDKKSLLAHINQIYQNYLRYNQNCGMEQITGIIEKAVSSHYGVRAIKELGFGEARYLLNQIKESGDQNDIVNNFNTSYIYEDSILDFEMTLNVPLNVDSDESYKEAVIKQLIECPLLENIYEYTQWDLLYSNLFGNLIDFIHENINRKSLNDEYGNKIVIIPLEVKPSVVVKLIDSNDKELIKSIENGDFIGAAGHLVSLIAVKYHSLSLAPCALLANQIHSAMVVYYKSFQNDDLNSSENSEFYAFILKWMQRMPIRFTSNCLFNFFIEPLSKIEGSVVKVKQLLFEKAKIMKDKYAIEFLNTLSILNCISEWNKQNVNESNSMSQSTVKPSIVKMTIEESKEGPVAVETPIENQTDNTSDSIKEVMVKKNEALVSEWTGVERDHIEKIRKSKYGVGIELNEDGQTVAEQLKGVIGRSLDRLSNELYNEDIHFVLELIQNADDNTYSESSIDHLGNDIKVEPTLVFLIQQDKITLFNNEIGFSNKNVEAICDVGSSTKGKHQRGYIGRKGIGFKSVFTVTDQPEVHSNNYHIKFDVTSNGHIGYILPLWVEENGITRINDLRKFLCSNIQDFHDKHIDLNTCIHLPLKSESEMQKHKSRSLTASFTDIQPSLLLFLNRLKSIVIINEKDELTFEKRHYHRVDINDSVIEIKCENQINKWLISRDILEVPNNIKPNEDVESTDLCLAFPVYQISTDNKTSYYEPLPKMDVFAYLPLRSFGFRFIIQADFDIPASRQDIRHDKEWNQWICKQIPKLFVNSFKKFESYEEYQDKISALIAYLKFVPLEEEVLGFFQHVATEIILLLRNEDIFPVFDTEDSSVIAWRKPFECVILNDPLTREVLTSDLLKKHLDRYYLHPRLYTNQVNQKLLQILGVRNLGFKDVIEILKEVFKNDSDNLTDVKQIAKWLVVLSRFLSDFPTQEEKDLITQVKRLPIIPLLSDETVSIDSRAAIFFPSKQNNSLFDMRTYQTEYNNEFCELVENDLNIVDLSTLLCLEPSKNIQIVRVLKYLGIKLIHFKDIINLHILPYYEKQDILNDEKCKEKIVNYLIYIHHFWSSNKMAIDINKLKEMIYILTNKGPRSLKDSKINLSEQLGSKYNLEKMLPGFDWCFVDTSYLDKSTLLNKRLNKPVNELKNSWRKLFNLLEIYDLFTISSKRIRIERKDINNPYLSYFDIKCFSINANDILIVDDYTCDMFEHYIKLLDDEDSIKNKDLVATFSNIFKIYEENWSYSSCGKSKYSDFKYVTLSVETSNKEISIISKESIESTFFKLIKSQKWIPCDKINFEVNKTKDALIIEKVAEKVFYKPNEIYLKNQETFTYYGEHAPYIDQPKSGNNFFHADIGINVTFDFKIFLNCFKEWCQVTKLNEKKKIFVSLAQMKAIYEIINDRILFIRDLELTKICKELIKQNPTIFVPDFKPNTKHPDEIRYGTFYNSDEVFWHDPTRLIPRYSPEFKPVFLNYHYGEYQNEKYKQMFMNTFEVADKPKNTYYISLLDHITSLVATNSMKMEDVLNDVYYVYETLLDSLFLFSENKDIDVSLAAQLLHEISSKSIFPCYGNKWRSLKDEPIIVDDTELAKHFTEKLNMLLLPQDANDANSFESKFRLENLSENARLFLEKVCEFKVFSKIVKIDFENLTTNLKPAPKLQNFCRKFLPYIQAFMCSNPGFKNGYKECVELNMSANIKNMKFFSTGKLENVYCCKLTNEVRVTIPTDHCCKRVKNETWNFYVNASIIENEKEILRGFTKVFIQNNSKLEKELIKFVSFIHRFGVDDLSSKDKREIEKDFDMSLVIPSTETLWIIDEIIEKSEIVEVEADNKQEQQKPYYKSNRVSAAQLAAISRKQQQLPIQIPAILPNPLTHNPDRTDRTANEPNQIYATIENTENLIRRTHNKNAIANESANFNNNIQAAGRVIQPLEREQQTEQPIINENSQQMPNQTSTISSIETDTQLPSTFASNMVNDIPNCIPEEPSTESESINPAPVDLLSVNIDNSASELNFVPNKFNVEMETDVLQISTTDWSQEILSELAAIRLSLDADDNYDRDNMTQIGKWGELFVYEILKTCYANEIAQNKIKIKWINKDNETGEPYDLKLQFYNDNNSIEREEFIEVKSTVHSSKESFPVSINQLLFAEANPDTYKIYRVYNVGSNQPSFKIIYNLSTQLLTHCINLFMII